MKGEKERDVIVGITGAPATVYPFGELNAEERTDSISVQFQYPFLNTAFDMNTPVGTGSVTVADGLLNVIAGAGETEHIETKNSIRYRPGHSGYAQFTAMFVGNGIGYAGVWAVDEDGFFIRVEEGQLALGLVKGNVETLVHPTNGTFFGGEIDVADIDLTKVNIFRIAFGYLGVANPSYEIKIGGTWRVLGTISTEGVLTSSHIDNPVLPLGFKAEDGMTVSTISMNAGKLGDSDFVGARFFPANRSKALVGTGLGTVATFHNKSTFKTVTNRVMARLIRYSFFVDAPTSGSGTVEFKITKNATLAGVPTWTDVDADNSVMEFDTVQTYASGGREIFVAHVAYAAGAGGAAKEGGGVEQNANEFGLFLLPNETATITAQNVNGATDVTARVVFNWIELF